MILGDWSSDVCSSDLHTDAAALGSMLYETFRASFGTRSFRCTPEECEAVAERVFEKVQK